jgi:hypothetical protein
MIGVNPMTNMKRNVIVEVAADTAYAKYGTFDRAICGISRQIAAAKTTADVIFLSHVIVLLADAKTRCGMERSGVTR